jgi:putative nucleotidyltransferase with HDIG domain
LRLYAALGQANSYRAIVEALRPEIERMLGYGSVWFQLVRGDNEDLLLLDAGGPVEESVKNLMQDERFRVRLHDEDFLVIPVRGDPFLTEIIEGHEIYVAEDARTHPLTNKDIVDICGNRTMVCMPLMLAERTLGALSTGTFFDEGVRVPTPIQLDYLRALSNHVAVAMDRVRFLGERGDAEKALQRSLLEVEAALEGAVTALSLAVGERDPYTARHQERVAKLACAIATEMGLPEATIESIRVAGVLHDIGKISVPAEILSRPSRLSDMEFAIVRTHSSVGHRLLESVPLHGRVATIVLQHHERLDGSGYPHGLRADDILFEAKILAVADVVEAMASHRPYRPALGLEAAIEEIERASGTLFDPDVVEACVKVLRDNDFTLG